MPTNARKSSAFTCTPNSSKYFMAASQMNSSLSTSTPSMSKMTACITMVCSIFSGMSRIIAGWPGIDKREAAMLFKVDSGLDSVLSFQSPASRIHGQRRMAFISFVYGMHPFDLIEISHDMGGAQEMLDCAVPFDPGTEMITVDVDERDWAAAPVGESRGT
ncbi:MAG: hypothetical protein ABIH23_32645 [bacterium]